MEKNFKKDKMIKEIFEKQIERENHERPDIQFIKEDSKAQTYRGYLQGKLQKARNQKNLEMTELMQEIIKEFNEFYPNKIVKYELRQIGGWKGKDKITIYKGFTEDFILIEHIKDKHSGKVKTIPHQVKKENVNRLLFWIKKWEIGESHPCYDFAEKIGEKDWKEVWKKRTDVYFKLYYFPIKCLESMGIIEYSGKGLITRIE